MKTSAKLANMTARFEQVRFALREYADMYELEIGGRSGIQQTAMFALGVIEQELAHRKREIRRLEDELEASSL